MTAVAETARVDFTSYLREGPSVRYRPVDEAPGGTSVEVIGCQTGWCQVRMGDAIGFLSEGVLRRGETKPGPGGPKTCFVNGQAGYHGLREMRFCQPSAVP